MVSAPVEAAAVGGGGEEELRLAQGEALGDPRPDVPHLLGADDLRGEGVGVEGQLHVPPGNRDDRQTRDGPARHRMSGWYMHVLINMYCPHFK